MVPVNARPNARAMFTRSLFFWQLSIGPVNSSADMLMIVGKQENSHDDNRLQSFLADTVEIG
jgi:hypothetical protein